MNTTGTKTAIVVRVLARTAPPDFLRTVEGGDEPRFSHLIVTVDILEHHDGVIDDHADRKRHASRLTTFRVRPNKSIMRKAPMMQIGMATAMTSVLVPLLRYRSRNADGQQSADHEALLDRPMALSMYSVWS